MFHLTNIINLRVKLNELKGLQEVYYLIKDGRNDMYMASGKTESKAWVNTKEFIMKLDAKKSKTAY
ncbi:MAG: hypothetical protein AABY22_30975 [Nanoarchaeota archaeon]